MPPTLLRPAPGTLAAPVLAIGYVRVSAAREEMISPELQREAIRAWAARAGRVIIDWVEDLDESGRTWNRKIMSVIKRVEGGEAKEVAVWKYSRFGRDRHGNALNLGRLHRVGGELQSATEEVDAATSVGRLTRGMLMELAAFESDRAGEQWAEAFAWRLEQGLPPLGGPRFGYDRVGRIDNPLGHGTFSDPNCEEDYIPNGAASAVERCFLDYVSGSGFQHCSRYLNRNGYRGTRGGLWYERSAAEMMGSGFAAGLIRVHDPDCHGPHERGAGRCPNRVYLPGKHDGIIDADLWDAFLNRRKHRAGLPRGSRAATHLYTGLLRCVHCGSPQSGAAKPEGFVEYNCSQYNGGTGGCRSNSVRSDRLDAVVLPMLWRWGSAIEAEAAAMQETPLAEDEPREDPAEAAEREITRIDTRIDKLLDVYLDERITKEEYDQKRTRLLAERETWTKQAKEAKEAATRQASTEERVQVVWTLREEWVTLPLARRRELLRRVVDRIVVDRRSRQDVSVTVRMVDGAEETFDVSYAYASHLRGTRRS